MSFLISEWMRRWKGTQDEVARQVQAIGLVKTGRMISRVLRKPAPTEEEFPAWIEEIFAAVGARLCEYDDGLPPLEKTDALEAAMGFVAAMPPTTRVEFQSLLVLLEMAPFIFGPRRRRFTELSEKEQSAHLAGWEGAEILPRKGAFRALKSVVMMGYWSRPQTFAHLGYSVAKNPGIPQRQRREWEKREWRGGENE